MTLQEILNQVNAAIAAAYESGDAKVFLVINLADGSMKVAKSYGGLLIAPTTGEERTERQRQEKYEKRQTKHPERWRTDKK